MEQFEGEKQNKLYKETMRIAGLLEKYFGKEKTIDAAGDIYLIVSDIDETIGEILKNKYIADNYDYDGAYLSRKDGRRTKLLFNGENILKEIDGKFFDDLFGLLRYEEDETKIRRLARFIQNYLEPRRAIARWLLKNLRDGNSEDFEGAAAGGTVSQAKEISGLTEEEKRFFLEYEKQLEGTDKK